MSTFESHDVCKDVWQLLQSLHIAVRVNACGKDGTCMDAKSIGNLPQRDSSNLRFQICSRGRLKIADLHLTQLNVSSTSASVIRAHGQQSVLQLENRLSNDSPPPCCLSFHFASRKESLSGRFVKGPLGRDAQRKVVCGVLFLAVSLMTVKKLHQQQRERSCGLRLVSSLACLS